MLECPPTDHSYTIDYCCRSLSSSIGHLRVTADVLQTSAAATIAALCENNARNQLALVEKEVARCACAAVLASVLCASGAVVSLRRCWSLAQRRWSAVVWTCAMDVCVCAACRPLVDLVRGKGRANIVVQLKCACAIEALTYANRRTQRAFLAARATDALIKLLKAPICVFYIRTSTVTQIAT